MYKKTFVFACLTTMWIASANIADASLVLVLRDFDSPDPPRQVVVIDNKVAGDTVGGWTATVTDANMTLGSAVFNANFGQFSTVNVTAQSKPELPLNEMDLGGIVSTQQSDTRMLTIFALDINFVGAGEEFRTETGGTNDGLFYTETFLNNRNTYNTSNFSGISFSPEFTPADSPFSWSETKTVTHGSPFALGVQAQLQFNSPGTTSFDTNLKQLSAVPEPTAALVWSVLAGVGLVVRRRR
ncbi:MAG: hypothetical protein MK108_11305 [Mariniblastus sp.]|nr:hypothetical protein [Mariniblastus sp.]